jgi:hypothetical protein
MILQRFLPGAHVILERLPLDARRAGGAAAAGAIAGAAAAP